MGLSSADDGGATFSVERRCHSFLRFGFHDGIVVLEEKLAERNSKLHAFAVELIRAEEDQRSRIARELHDGVGQIMTAVNIELQDAARHRAERDAHARRRRARARGAVSDRDAPRVARAASGDPRRARARRSGARARRAHGQARAHRDRVRRAGRGRSRPRRRGHRLLSTGAGGAQQRRASRRRQAAPRCRCIAASIGSTVTVTDDGRGMRYDPSSPDTARDGHFGLLGMQERIRAIGGTFKYGPPPDKRGTQIHAEFPVA